MATTDWQQVQANQKQGLGGLHPSSHMSYWGEVEQPSPHPSHQKMHVTVKQF